MTIANDQLKTAEQAAARAFEIRRLFHEGAVNRTAALLSLSVLRYHPNDHVGRLCERIADDIDRPRPQGDVVAGYGFMAQ